MSRVNPLGPFSSGSLDVLTDYCGLHSDRPRTPGSFGSTPTRRADRVVAVMDATVPAHPDCDLGPPMCRRTPAPGGVLERSAVWSAPPYGVAVGGCPRADHRRPCAPLPRPVPAMQTRRPSGDGTGVPWSVSERLQSVYRFPRRAPAGAESDSSDLACAETKIRPAGETDPTEAQRSESQHDHATPPLLSTQPGDVGFGKCSGTTVPVPRRNHDRVRNADLHPRLPAPRHLGQDGVPRPGRLRRAGWRRTPRALLSLRRLDHDPYDRSRSRVTSALDVSRSTANRRGSATKLPVPAAYAARTDRLSRCASVRGRNLRRSDTPSGTR